MADQKVTELAEISSLSSTDLLHVVTDVGGTPVNEAISAPNLLVEVNAQHYGAVGDGIADDTSAIQTAIDAVSDLAIGDDGQGGGNVRLPAGKYLISSTLLIDSPGVSISGDGHDATNILADGVMSSTMLQVGDGVTNYCRYNTVRDIFFDGNNRTSGDGVHCHYSASSLIDRCRFKNCGGYNIHIENSLAVSVNECKITGSTLANVYVENRSNIFRISNCRVQVSRDGAGIEIDGPNTFAFTVEGCGIESNGLTTAAPGLLIGATDIVKGGTITGNHFENNDTPVNEGQLQIGRSAAIGACGGISISGNWFSGDAAAFYAMGFGNAGGIFVGSNAAGSHNNATFYIGADADNGVYKMSEGLYSESTRTDGPGEYAVDFDNSNVTVAGTLTLGGSGSKTIAAPGNLTIEPGTGTVLFLGEGSVFQAQGNNLGFYSTAPKPKPTITGSRGGNAALADLLTKLATLGLITDSTS